MKTSLALGAFLALTAASAAFAQTPAAAPAAAPVGGPPIPGMCTINIEGVIQTSAVGKVVRDRLEQLQAVVTAELTTEQQQLQTENNAINAIPPEQQQAPATLQRINLFKERYRAFEQKNQQRAQELKATEQAEIRVIAQNLNPILAQIYTERKCGLVLNQYAFANPQMDVSEVALQRLNAKITTLVFDRVHLDQQGGAAAPAPAPAPAAPPKTSKKK